MNSASFKLGLANETPEAKEKIEKKLDKMFDKIQHPPPERSEWRTTNRRLVHAELEWVTSSNRVC
jgi:hypothetical protein